MRAARCTRSLLFIFAEPFHIIICAKRAQQEVLQMRMRRGARSGARYARKDGDAQRSACECVRAARKPRMMMLRVDARHRPPSRHSPPRLF